MPDNSEIFDREAFLNRMMGDKTIVTKIISGVANDMPTMFFDLKQSIKAKNPREAGRHAHTMKGAALNLICPLFAKAALDVEKAGKSGDLDAVIRLLPQMENQWEKLAPQLRKACE
ncbi:MAG: Hpt domain-containing protein [Deltaproteobacteria bacterium]|nr:Hpt domain-containing protein [Deltaproteobacteria bacterium]